MTEKQVQQMAAEAIAEARCRPEKYYHVCWWEGRLQCLPIHHTEEMHGAFYAAPGQMFVDGLSSHQWRLVTTRVLEFCHSHGITLRRDSSGRKRRASSEAAKANRQVTAFDSMRLCALLASVRSPKSTMSVYLDKLQQLLETADTVAPEEVPDNVVTMNSRVRLEDEREENEMTCSLVFPTESLDDADLDKMNVSILTPIGLSLLGRRVGDTVEGRVKIQELMYQPEAAGDFDV